MTLEAWVNPAALSRCNRVMLKERGTNALSYGLYANDGWPQVGGFQAPAGYVRAGGFDQAVRDATAIPLGTWTHLATTYDGTTLRVYVNGVQVGSLAATGTIASSTGQVTIGGNSVWGEYFAGAVDDVRIYNRALSAAEITSLMNTIVP